MPVNTNQEGSEEGECPVAQGKKELIKKGNKKQ